mmetsp:Transcript_30310/g.38892  ORF Transcript_30310/g.38892 Transcript_30310/m.38892 type:complete len:797 (+) Transcript_30310:218-2608(+)
MKFKPEYFMIPTGILTIVCFLLMIVIPMQNPDGFKHSKHIGQLIGLFGGSFALFVTSLFARSVVMEDEGTGIQLEIAKNIQEGARAFLKAEYRILLFVCLVIFIIITAVVDWGSGVAFLIGSSFSAICGYMGMTIATLANVRTAEACKTTLNGGLRVAFKSGAVMGMSVVGFAVFGMSLLMYSFNDAHVLHAFGFGGSTIALFARVGGGIYTKAADVGTDLVGKVEEDIPEDDPRNPGVIADNVGDNVGDVAGMGADLFESYCGSLISALSLTAASKGHETTHLDIPYFDGKAVSLPFILCCLGIVSSLCGIMVVRTKEGATQGDLLSSIRKGTLFGALIYMIASIILMTTMGFGANLIISMLLGLIAGILIGFTTEYYTSFDFRPTQVIAEAGVTGPATVIIQGFGVGLQSTFLPVMIAALALYGSIELGGPFGVSLAAIGMLSNLGVTLATDAYGPVADNAGGIAEMAGLDPKVRERTDALDALGNTTAAVGKGFAVGSAMLTSLALLQAFMEKVGITAVDFLNDSTIMPGILIGGMLPYLFSSMTMLAVGRAAGAIIEEVRRQFREIPGLREGTGVAEYSKCVMIATKAALKEMVLPGLLAVMVPVSIGLLWGPTCVIGLLIGSVISASMLAIVMGNAGGAWDNAKKYCEGYPETQKHLGGKGTEIHKANVTGDTVGDPFKDTSGPSLDILIKLMSHVTLMLAGIFVNTKYWYGLICLGVTSLITFIIWKKLFVSNTAAVSPQVIAVLPKDESSTGKNSINTATTDPAPNNEISEKNTSVQQPPDAQPVVEAV